MGFLLHLIVYKKMIGDPGYHIFIWILLFTSEYNVLKNISNNNCPYSLDKDVQKYMLFMQAGLAITAVREHTCGGPRVSVKSITILLYSLGLWLVIWEWYTGWCYLYIHCYQKRVILCGVT